MELLFIACVLLATVGGQEVVRTSGLDQSITIKPYGNSSAQQTLGRSENFTFICSSSASSITPFVLHILGPGNETKLAKVSQNQTTLGTIFTYNITNYTDDQTTFRCQSGSLISPNLTLTVFFGPIYTEVSHPFGNNDTEVSVTVSLTADPPVGNHFNWSLNDSDISSNSRITLTSDKISFNPLYVSDSGRYVVNGCNNISCANQSFDLVVYFPPVFGSNGNNFTELTEVATGTSKNLTCSVIAELGPHPLNITLSTDPRLEDVTKTSTATSITVMITNANASDIAKYQCQACYGDDVSFCSFYWFDTYVGGPPDRVTVQNFSIVITEPQQGNSLVSISCIITDNSTVPMTGVRFVTDPASFNHSVEINAPLNGESQIISVNFTVDDGGVLDNGFNLDIYAINMLGSSSVTSIIVVGDISTSSWLFLVLVIACPIGGLCLILLLCIPCCCYCYQRKKNTRGFRLVNMQDDD